LVTVKTTASTNQYQHEINYPSRTNFGGRNDNEQRRKSHVAGGLEAKREKRMGLREREITVNFPS